MRGASSTWGLRRGDGDRGRQGWRIGSLRAGCAARGETGQGLRGAGLRARRRRRSTAASRRDVMHGVDGSGEVAGLEGLADEAVGAGGEGGVLEVRRPADREDADAGVDRAERGRISATPSATSGRRGSMTTTSGSSVAASAIASATCRRRCRRRGAAPMPRSPDDALPVRSSASTTRTRSGTGPARRRRIRHAETWSGGMTPMRARGAVGHRSGTSAGTAMRRDNRRDGHVRRVPRGAASAGCSRAIGRRSGTDRPRSSSPRRARGRPSSRPPELLGARPHPGEAEVAVGDAAAGRSPGRRRRPAAGRRPARDRSRAGPGGPRRA